eukprot:GHVU01067195.1.p3 GENE.GHVU01067195.1~~GHVU01067195.1.p3  ORF type:complete len:134 (+),score=7.60 GHVU01067195.1:1971-2372(+)
MFRNFYLVTVVDGNVSRVFTLSECTYHETDASTLMRQTECRWHIGKPSDAAQESAGSGALIVHPRLELPYHMWLHNSTGLYVHVPGELHYDRGTTRCHIVAAQFDGFVLESENGRILLRSGEKSKAFPGSVQR